MILDDLLNRHVPARYRKWLWFVILWLLGFGAVSLLGYVIRLAMGL